MKSTQAETLNKAEAAFEGPSNTESMRPRGSDKSNQLVKEWEGVTRRRPCPSCHKDSWCQISSTMIMCRRPNDSGIAETKFDKDGAAYCLYPLGAFGLKDGNKDQKSKNLTAHVKALAPDTLSKLYTSFLELLQLSESHRENLSKRGLNLQEIAIRGYRSWPLEGRHQVVKQILEKYDSEACKLVPGFYEKVVRDQRWIEIAGSPGLLIPVRNLQGEVVAIKIRKDQNVSLRYLYLSSRARNGASPGAPAHVPLFPGKTGKVVRITEGELKADIATVLSNTLTISAPGVGNYKATIPILKQLEAKTVKIAFDQDFRINSLVAHALANAIQALENEGFKIEVESWDPVYKGIDDALLAGAKIEVTRTTPSFASDEWETPVSLSDPELPLFPLDAFPPVLADFARDLAGFTETPIELAAMLTLATLSTATARGFDVEVKPGYREPTNIWVCPTLESGNRKSAVHTECTLPLLEWQQEQAETLGPKIKETLSKIKSEEAYVQSLRSKLGTTKNPDDRSTSVNEIADLESKIPEIPKPPQLWSSDFTPEKLGMMMAENNERMAILSDEAGIFEIMGGRYSKGVPNLDLMLKGHAGSPERVDRANRPSILLNRPALTIGISPQPSVLQALAETPSFRGRGLLARFLYAYPKSFVGYRTGKGSPLTDAVRNKYKDLIRSILKSTFQENGWELRPTQIISLSSEALEHWIDFAQELEPKLREGAELSSIVDWAGKLPGAAIRIAGQFHVAKYVNGSPANIPIEAETILSALDIASTLIPHALMVFGLIGTDPDLENAKHVLRWIAREQLAKFSQRDCHNALQRRFRRIENLKPALQILQERHHIRPAPQESVSHRPSTKYLVNPKVMTDQVQ